jgi:hypothetical protein
MPNNAKKAKLRIEGGVTLNAMSALTTTDKQVFKHATVGLFSQDDDYAPVIRPDGVINGGEVTPDTTNDQVDVAAINLWLAGVKTAVAAAPGESITRSALATHRINSITVNSGGAIAVVPATDDAGATSFVETRGAVGGPPYIPVGSVEIRQVRTVSATPALILESEILSVPGQHLELYDYPGREVQLSEDVDDPTSVVKFDSVLPASHTGDLAKGVFAEVYEPTAIDFELVSEFVTPEISDSVASVEVYNKTLGTDSSSINAGSFNIKLNDGVTDQIVKKKGKRLWFWFYPNRDKEPFLLLNGKLGIGRTFPVSDFIQANCTISAQSVGKEISA